MDPTGVLDDLLDGQQVTDDATVTDPVELRVFRERHRVVGRRAVDLGRRDDDQSAHPGCRRSGHQGLGRAHDEVPAFGRAHPQGALQIGLGGHPDGDVDVPQRPDQGGVGRIDQTPFGRGDPATVPICLLYTSRCV